MSTPIAKQTPWQIQRAVVFAVFIRELNARFGRFTLGYLWALIEPLFFVLILSVIRGRFTGAPIAGLQPMIFFASGVLPFILFRNIATSGISAVEANQGLFNYQRVKPADAFAARYLLELMIIVAVTAVLFPALKLCGVEFHFNDVLLTLAVLGLLLLFTAGIGLVFTILGAIWVEAKKVIPMALRPLFFISGIFFPFASLPEQVRPYLAWNPLLHALDLLRSAAFTGHTSNEGSWTYLAASALLTFAFGLALYRIYRIRIVTSGTLR